MAREFVDKFFRNITVLFIFRGVSFVRKKNKILTVIQLILITHNILNPFVFLVNSPFFFKKWTKDTFLYNMGMGLWAIEMIVVTIYFLLLRRKISAFVKRLFSSLNSYQSNSLCRKVLGLSTIGMICYLQRCSLATWDRWKTGQLIWSLALENWVRNIRNFIFDFQTFDVAIFTSLAYLIFYEVLRCYALFNLSRIQRYMSKDKPTHNLNTVGFILEDTCESFEEFDGLFSLLPFMTFTTTFATGLITLVIIMNVNTLGKGISVISLLFSNFFVTYNLFYIHRTKHELSRECNRIRKQLLGIERAGEQIPRLLSISLFSLLDKLSSVQLTAWSFFTLDRSLLLTYVSNVMTFMTLFLQITS